MAWERSSAAAWRTRQYGHLPVVEQIPVTLDAGERREIARLAGRIRRRAPRLAADDEYGPAVRVGLGRGPGFFLHDTAGVQRVLDAELSALEYRPLALAGAGDCLAICGNRVPAYEDYCRDVLGLGDVEVLRARSSAPGAPLATRCRTDPEVLGRLAAIARLHGGMTVHPYISSGPVWQLAAAIAERAGAPIHVAAPLPRLARCVNDKLWFAKRTAELLGERSLPPGAKARDLPSLARHVAALGREHAEIVIKLPSAAGSRGNVVIASEQVRGRSDEALRHFLDDLLAGLGWRRAFPLLVSAWESPVVMSPSVQLWIPPAEDGPPIVEGIFEQRTTGVAGTFIGAIPASLPRHVEARIAGEAVILGTYFQELRYFGRCSFDAILVGHDVATAALHWVECNGRWGGTSTPMTLVNRLVGDWTTAPFETVAPDWPLRISFTEALDRTADRLFRPGDRAGIVFVSPGDVVAGTGLQFVAVAETLEAACAGAYRANEALRS
jgi:hypothetical protein